MYCALPSARSRLSRSAAYLCRSASMSIVVIPHESRGNLTVGSRSVSPDGTSAGRREELQRDVVGVAEGQTRPVMGVDDAAVSDAEALEVLLPRFEFGPVGAGERHVVEARPQLVEGFRARRVRVLVDPVARPAEQPHHV